MKIAIIVRNYHKHGGISRCAAELAEHSAAGNEVHVFSASLEDAGGPALVFHKVPMLSFGFLKKRNLNALNNIFEIASFALFSWFKVNPDDFDIVHSHGSYIGRSDVFTTHSCHAESLAVSRRNRTGFLGRLKKTALNPLHLILLFMEYCSLKNAKKIVSVSRNVKNDIIRHYNIQESRIEVIVNGVDIKKFNPANKTLYKNLVRSKHGLKPEDKVIIFPAHEFERKGLRRIIEALNVIHYSDLYVLVVGEDAPAAFTAIIKKYGLNRNIIFTGKVTDVEKYYFASDLFVMPTYYEPFGLVILEAMAVGLPVITSRQAGASELIADNMSGLILEDHADFLGIAKAIRYLLNDPKAAETFGTNARQTAEQYSWDVISGKTLKLYENMVSQVQSVSETIGLKNLQ